MQPVIFKLCEDIKLVEQDVHLNDDGHMLVIPVYLYSVYPCRKMIVVSHHQSGLSVIL